MVSKPFLALISLKVFFLIIDAVLLRKFAKNTREL
jgi:hypothetical protein